MPARTLARRRLRGADLAGAPLCGAIFHNVDLEGAALTGPVLRLRFGLDGEQSHTLADIGGMFSVSPERVRQIEESALSDLRTLSRRQALEVPLEGRETVPIAATRRCSAA
ncbi:sigma factor-like helix-turn-helix DNA-binding protein [Sorangium sp. So ce1335]|uniref:pentapeptide repeat-containing protein n=1 Tax=Sorangium sp. So ce1335 TaxID=3133335 RepID=UPI003F5EAA44